MGVLRPISPEALKRVFEEGGFRVIDEGELNWTLARGDKDEPLIIPKKGKVVTVPVMAQAMRRARDAKLMQKLLKAVSDEPPAADDQPDDD